MHASESARFAELNASWTAECNMRFSQYEENTAEMYAPFPFLPLLTPFLVRLISKSSEDSRLILLRTCPPSRITSWRESMYDQIYVRFLIDKIQ